MTQAIITLKNNIMPSIQRIKKIRNNITGVVITDPSIFVIRPTDEMPFTRSEKEKLDLVNTGSTSGDTIVNNYYYTGSTSGDTIVNNYYYTGSTSGNTNNQYNVVIHKRQVVWNEGWVKISTNDSYNINKKIINVNLFADFGYGTVKLTPIINYPSSDTYNSTPFNGFYLKDSDNLLREDSDFAFISLGYDVLLVTGLTNYDGKKMIFGENVISDHEHNDSLHSWWTFYWWFEPYYPNFSGLKIQSEQDSLSGYGSINHNFMPTYCELKDANLILRPYFGAGFSENIGSNPNILTVASHLGNVHTRYNNGFVPDSYTGSTYNPDYFFDNVVMVSACSETGDTFENWSSSFGYGVEFFEYSLQQSPATGHVGARLKEIKMESGANWSIVRNAARMTASNSVYDNGTWTTNWNMYQGFGLINVRAAIQYIKDNYKNDKYRDDLADKYEGLNGLSPFLEYGDLYPNSPVAKRMFDEKTASQEFDDFPVVNPVILKGISLTSGSTKNICSVDGGVLGLKMIDGSVIYNNSINSNTSIKDKCILKIPINATTLNMGGSGSTYEGSLDISNLNNLLTLNVENNLFTGVTIGNNQNIQTLNLYNNPISELNIPNLRGLETINISGCASLGLFHCHQSELPRYDITGGTFVRNYGITNLNIVGCTGLTHFNCRLNRLSGILDVGGFSNLTHIFCDGNNLSGINIVGCTSLRELYIDNNQINSINISGNMVLQYFTTKHNNMGSLNMSNCSSMVVVECGYNQINNLNLINCGNLTKIDSPNNLITSLDLSGCIVLRDVRLASNQLDINNINSIINQLTNLGSTGGYLNLSSNPGSVGLNQNDYILHTSMGWTIIF